jgi:hypothetical protein
MRQLRKNKQVLYYANYLGQQPIYAKSYSNLLTESDDNLLTEDDNLISNVNIMTTNVDGEEVEVAEAYKDIYTPPVKFKANISFDSGETHLDEYGLNPSDYNAIISADKGKLPFDERTLIWFQSELEYDEEGDLKPETADYRVVAIKTSLNEERFLLKKRVDDE